MKKQYLCREVKKQVYPVSETNKTFMKFALKAFITVLIVFTTGILSNISASTLNNISETKGDTTTKDTVTIDIPADELYGGWWDVKDIHYNYTDSFAKTLIDSAFSLEILLTEHSEYVHPRLDRVTSGFGVRRGRFHYGTDVDLNTGDSLFAAFDGVVRVSKYNKGYGHMVVIRHANGLETVYAHLYKRKVDSNDVVKAGQFIGYGGNTGRSYGSHLHFETRYLGVAINPQDIINFETGELISDTLSLTAANFSHIKRIQELKKAKYIKIKSGDCLSKIAVRYGTSVSRLCQLNGISRTTVLRVGKTLRVR